jgi:hypothetical protein
MVAVTTPAVGSGDELDGVVGSGKDVTTLQKLQEVRGFARQLFLGNEMPQAL